MFPQSFQNPSGFSANGGSATVSSGTSIALSPSAARVQSIAMTAAGKTVTLPDATQLSTGGANFVFQNTGAYSYTVNNFAGTAIATVAPNATQICSLYLVSNATSSGVWGNGTAGTGLVYLSTITASASSLVDFSSSFSSTYDDYVLIATNTSAGAGSAQTQFRVCVSGSAVSTTTYGYTTNTMKSNTPTWQNSLASPSTTNSFILDASGQIPAKNSYQLTIFDVNSAVSHNMLVLAVGDAAQVLASISVGTNATTSVLTGITVSPTLGTLTGVYKLYGVAKA